MKLPLMTTAAMLLSVQAVPAAAQDDRGSGANVVRTFGSLCLPNNPSPETISAAVAATSGWAPTAFPDDHKTGKADTKLSWSGAIDGRAFELLVTKNARAGKLGTTCLLRTAAKERFYPYFDEFRTVTKNAGLSGRETDVPHFYRASGKLADGRVAEAILSTRFPAGRTNYTALQVAY